METVGSIRLWRVMCMKRSRMRSNRTPRRQSEATSKREEGPKRSHPSTQTWYSRSSGKRASVRTASTVAHGPSLVDVVVV